MNMKIAYQVVLAFVRSEAENTQRHARTQLRPVSPNDRGTFGRISDSDLAEVPRCASTSAL
jgi:hypothetical protein